MNEQLALLKAIVTDPADDTVRLAYADWLDETAGTVPCRACGGKGWNGLGHMGGYTCRDCGGSGRVPDANAARAAFIRVQCELARMPADVVHRARVVIDPYAENALTKSTKHRPVVEAAKLRRRERELLDGGGWQEWQGACSEVIPKGAYIPDRIAFRRGFVEALTCTAADWLAHADSLYWHPGLTDPCPRCDGTGKAVGSDRPFEWHGLGSYPGLCRAGCDKGRVPRPCPPTACPITEVTVSGGDVGMLLLALTPRYGANGGEWVDSHNPLRWPGIRFHHTANAPA